MPKLIDITGKRFGRLVVIKRINSDKWDKPKWLCKCDCKCEKEIIVSSGNLRMGHTKSCGCLRKEITSEIKTKHGHSTGKQTSKTYNSWVGMTNRCLNNNDKSYSRYGGRGIKVCKRWRKFKNFLADMGEVPAGCQIDRIDNNENYCESNCRWVTPKQQQRNRRNNHLITHYGKTQCLSAWAEEFNIHPSVLRGRIIYGWSIEKALTVPTNKWRK